MDTTSLGLRVAGTTVVLVGLLCISGCGPKSATSLRKAPRSVLSFEVSADCETVYDRIAQRARGRYLITGLAAHQPGISANLSPSRQFATVSLWDGGRIGLRYMLTADIRQIEPLRTQVDFYSATRHYTKEAILWAQWASTPLKD